jgi:hypothetical protein
MPERLDTLFLCVLLLPMDAKTNHSIPMSDGFALSKLTMVNKTCVKYTLACKDNTLTALKEWFHLNQAGILNLTDDFCFLYKCQHKILCTWEETDEAF